MPQSFQSLILYLAHFVSNIKVHEHNNFLSCIVLVHTHALSFGSLVHAHPNAHATAFQINYAFSCSHAYAVYGSNWTCVRLPRGRGKATTSAHCAFSQHAHCYARPRVLHITLQGTRHVELHCTLKPCLFVGNPLLFWVRIKIIDVEKLAC